MPNNSTATRRGRHHDKRSESFSSTSTRRREASRSRQRDLRTHDAASTSGLSLASLASTSVQHADENETEMFSGAASHVIPSSISSFHHTTIPQQHMSPLMPAISPDQDGDAGLGLERVPSNADFQERANFRFFTTEQIEAAKGASSLQTQLIDGTAVDYDTNWNTYEGDYALDTPSRTGSVAQLSTYYGGEPLAQTHSYTPFNEAHGMAYGSTHGSDEELFRDDLLEEFAEEADLSSDHSDSDTRSNVMIDIRHHDKLFGSKFPAKNHSQRFYLAEEDLVLGIAGYRTSALRLALYYLLIACTGGLLYLVLRWFPRYRIRMMGRRAPLAKAEWVVVEDEYGVLDIVDVQRFWYNRSLSSFLGRGHHRRAAGEAELNAATATERKNMYGELGLDDTDPVVPVLISFDYRYMRLFYDPLEDLFKLPNNWIDDKWCRFPDIKDGISEDTYKSRSLIFGANLINIREKSVLQLLSDEILHPFYVFQVFSILLWLADDYYYYAFCIFLISVFSVVESLVETKRTMRRMRDISRFQCGVRVWRNGFWKEINSSELVPGDIYEVSDSSLTLFPCDAILLTGDCIVNEAMLTGESVPVSKVPVSPEVARDLEVEFHSTKFSNSLSRSFLYSGTKIVRCRYGSGDDEPATALVVRTGFNTTKGALVRSMLFPKPSGFKFYEDSFKYIGVMAGIAGVGFVFSCINFIKLGLGWKIIVLRALDLVTIVVPPALPATLTIGTSFALSRLRKKDVFCIAPTRINVGGKLDVMCFDKTGTLTEEGLDILGVRVSQPIAGRKEREFSDTHVSADEMFGSGNSCAVPTAAVPQTYDLFLAMLSCHSLKLVDGELIGDPLDLKTFEFTGWDIVEEPREDPVLGQYVSSHTLGGSVTPVLLRPRNRLHNDTFFVQLREFEFVSQLRRMSVICQSLNDPSTLHVYVKGAPEVIESLCAPDTIPTDYEELLHHYTHNGYRVIACAAKRLRVPNGANLSDLRFVGDLSREKCESELDFVGFIVFENRLKPATKPALLELREANLRTVMCTGDNVLTAISVARECEMIEPNYKVYVPSFEYEAAGERLPVAWSEVDDPELQLDPVTLAPLAISQDERYCIAVTGDIFKYILTELESCELLIERMLMKGAIFARMSPDEKHELVDRLKQLDYTVGFCGDGANDCGALKAADVGISLSEAEASVAAPFTSRVFDISCVLEVIKEGRAALVTSFSCFQFMSLYSAIQFVTVSILYKQGTNLGDFQFLYIDLFLIIPIAVFMSWSKPFPRLFVKRPTANLISPKILIPLMGNIAILLVFQTVVWITAKDVSAPWYVAPVPGGDDEVKSTDNTVLFLYSNFQYIMVGVLLTVGPPYREPAKQNGPFVATVAATALFSALLMAVNPESWFADLMDLTWVPGGIRMLICVAAALNYVVLELASRFVLVKIARFYKRVFGQRKSKKRFKILRREFSIVGSA